MAATWVASIKNVVSVIFIYVCIYIYIYIYICDWILENRP